MSKQRFRLLNRGINQAYSSTQTSSNKRNPNQPHHAEKKHANRVTILYAEDDPDDFEFMEFALQNIGANVTLIRAENGREAIDYLEDAHAGRVAMPNLIVLDFNLPVMDGSQVLATMRSRREFDSLTVVIFTTSVDLNHIKESCSGNVPVISKPSNSAGLEEAANYLVGLIGTKSTSNKYTG